MKNNTVKKIILRATCVIILLAMSAVLFASCGSDDANGDDTLYIPSKSTFVPGETESPETEPVSAEKRVSFLAVGDNLIHECVYLDAERVAFEKSVGRKYIFEDFYTGVEDQISSADLAFVNCEGPMSGEYAPAGYPSFNAPVEAGEALINVGFDIVNLANNHMLDCNGASGLAGTISYWKGKENITEVGGYEGYDDYNSIRVIEKNGIRIAVLSYTYGTNGNYLPAGTDNLYIPYTEDGEIERQIAEAKTLADAVVVSMHWGEENTFEPTSEQRRLAGLVADAGADVIIGHHSHTIQPVEIIKGKNGNDTLVYYSLGNFLHTQIKAGNLVGGIATFDIVMSEDKVRIENPLFTPPVCHYTADTSVLDSLDYYKRKYIKIFYLSDYTEDLSNDHGCHLFDEFTYQDLKNYVTDTISSEYLAD